jgi:hypothetical protein
MYHDKVILLTTHIAVSGLLGVGFTKYGSMDSLRTNPVQHLFDVSNIIKFLF